MALSEEPDGEGLSPEWAADVISLAAGTAIPAQVIATWTVREREEAVRWAAAEHVSASDNPGTKRLAKPPVVLAAELLAASPAVAQIAVEQWTVLLEHAERCPEAYADPGAQTVLMTARGAVTGLLTLLAGRPQGWKEQAAQVLKEHPEGVRTVDLFAMLGRAVPSQQALFAWLTAGEEAGTLDEIFPGTWRLREARHP